MPHTTDQIHFAPPEHAIDALIAALIDPTQSLAHVAATHNTTADALALWLARPDIAKRIRHHESAHATRLRLTATTQLSHALQTVTKILTDYNAIQSPQGNAGADVAPDHASTPTSPESPDRAVPSASTSDITPTRPPESPIRAAETACRATSLLLRLARYYPALQPREPLFADHAQSRPKPSYYESNQSRGGGAAQAAGVSYYSDNTARSSAQAAQPSEPNDDDASAARATSDNYTDVISHPTPNPVAAPTPVPDPIDQDLAPDIEDDLDPDLDLDADLDLDNDPDFDLDLTPTERSTLPNLLSQVRQLTAAHPP